MNKLIHIAEKFTVNRPHARIDWVDNAKALGIFLVVFGHTYPHWTFCKSLIYCFHMPLFFFLSGYLLKEKYLDGEFQNFIWRAFRVLIIPYFSFWIISFGFRMATCSLQHQLVHTGELSYIDQLTGFIFGISDKLNPTNSALWFFTCLFCTTILFYWLSKCQKAGLLLSLLALLGLIGPLIHNYIEWRLPWNLDVSFVSVVFYGIGYFASKTVTIKMTNNTANRILILIIFFVILITCAKMNGKVSIDHMHFGNLLLFYIGAFSGIGATILLAKMLPINVWFEWLSRNTIAIFSTHIIIFCVFKGLSKKFLNINPYVDNWDIGLLYTIGALVICYPISFIIDRYFPWMVGNRKLLPRKLHSFHPKVSQLF